MIIKIKGGIKMHEYVIVKTNVAVLKKYFPNIDFEKPMKRHDLTIMWKTVEVKKAAERVENYLKIAADKGIVPGCEVIEPHNKGKYIVSKISEMTGMVSLKGKGGSYNPIGLDLAK